jgi:hypothetical protein
VAFAAVQSALREADVDVMRTLNDGAIRLAADDVVSPELALVDPDLAARERERLTEHADTLRRRSANGQLPSTPTSVPTPVPTPIPALRFVPAPSVVRTPAPMPATTPARDGIRPSPRTSRDESAEAARRLDELAAHASEPPRSIVHRLPRVLALLAVASVGLILAFLLTDRQLGQQEAAATDGPAQAEETGAPPSTEPVDQAPRSSTEPAEPPPSPAPVDEPPPSSTDQETTSAREPASSRPQRFAWAPEAGASAYHVELFLRSTRIFAANTPRPEITIPGAWTFGGKRHRFEPAEYRWYVWPVVDGNRTTSAVVQARLVVDD